MAYIVFDFDGTLADMKQLFIEVGNDIAVKKGWRLIDDAMFDKLSRGSMRDGLKHVGIPLRDVPFLLLEGKRRLAMRSDEITLFPGTYKLIDALHAAGHQLFVLSTNSRKLITTVLERNQLADKVTVLPSSGLFGKAPALKRFIRGHRIGKGEVWLVGDELRDVEAAKRAGVRSIAVLWGLQHPDTLLAAHPTFVAEKPEQITNYISNAQ